MSACLKALYTRDLSHLCVALPRRASLVPFVDIICLNEVYKFLLRNFSTGCIFYVLIIIIKKIRFFSPKYVRYEISVVLQNRFLKVVRSRISDLRQK